MMGLPHKMRVSKREEAEAMCKAAWALAGHKGGTWTGKRLLAGWNVVMTERRHDSYSDKIGGVVRRTFVVRLERQRVSPATNERVVDATGGEQHKFVPEVLAGVQLNYAPAMLTLMARVKPNYQFGNSREEFHCDEEEAMRIFVCLTRLMGQENAIVGAP